MITLMILFMISCTATLIALCRSKKSHEVAVPVTGPEIKLESVPVEIPVLTRVKKRIKKTRPHTDPINPSQVRNTLGIRNDGYIHRLRCSETRAVIVDCKGHREVYRTITRYLGTCGVKHRCLPDKRGIVLSRQHLGKILPVTGRFTVDFQNLTGERLAA